MKDILKFSRIVLLFAAFCVLPALAQQVVTHIPIGKNSLAAAVNIRTNKVYVTEQAADGTQEVSVIDAATNTVSSIIPLGGSGVPSGIAADANTNRIYVSNAGGIIVIDGETDRPIGIVQGGALSILALNPKTNQIYAGLAPSGTITVINGANNRVVTTITGVLLESIAVDTTRNLIYAGGFTADTHQEALWIIDGTSNLVTATLPMPQTAGDPRSVAVDENLNRIYLSDAHDAEVNVIDGNTNTLLTTFSLPSVGALEVDSLTHHVFVSSFPPGNAFASVDPVTFQPRKKIVQGVQLAGASNALNPVTKLSYSPILSGVLAVVSVP